MGVSPAGAEAPFCQPIVEVDERRVVLVRDVVRHVIDVQDALERYVVVHVTGFLEVIEPTDIVQVVVQSLAEQLELLRQLPLMLRIGDFLERLRRAVEIGADVPLDLPVAGDGLEVEALVDMVDAGGRATEHVIARKVRTGRIGGVDVAGLRGREIEPDPRLIRAEVGEPGRDVPRVIRTRWSANVPGTDERRTARRCRVRWRTTGAL